MANVKQIEIAEKLGFDVTDDSKRVAAARIEDFLFEVIYPDGKYKEASERQVEYANSLGIKKETDSGIIISALIEDELEKQNIEAINNLKLSAGDEVVINEYGFEKTYIISSIGKNYRMWFKGGNGRGAWPSKVISKKKIAQI